jgi:hypothetical protein
MLLITPWLPLEVVESITENLDPSIETDPIAEPLIVSLIFLGPTFRLDDPLKPRN